MTRKMILSQARTKVVTDGAEDDVGGIASATFEIAAAKMAPFVFKPSRKLSRRRPSLSIIL